MSLNRLMINSLIDRRQSPFDALLIAAPTYYIYYVLFVIVTTAAYKLRSDRVLAHYHYFHFVQFVIDFHMQEFSF